MTLSQPDRLDRIEALVESAAKIAESNAKAIEASANDRQELRALVESNAKAIEASANDQQELRALVESNAKAIEASANDQQELRALVESNAKAIEASASDRATLRTAIDELARVAGQTLRHMEEMQSEVRGLQLENRRMLDHLFGQNGDGNGD